MKLKNKKPGKNEFFDIKPLKDWGIIWFPISMSNISTSQNVKKCMEWINFFGEKKVGEPKIGLNVSYTDFLYLNSDEKASILKEKFLFKIVNHKNGFKKLIYKNRMNQILHAFHFESFVNLYLEIEGDFNAYFKKIKELYKKDNLFQKYLKEDSNFFKRGLTKNQLNFFLEENLVTYLILNMKVNFRNEYVQGRERWILSCYPGTPLKSQIYLCQLNPFKFKAENPYYGEYNLLNKKFYDFNNLDLETWNYE